jgi:hypothetical protein
MVLLGDDTGDRLSYSEQLWMPLTESGRVRAILPWC